jgi:quinol monooxygenase YgiN
MIMPHLQVIARHTIMAGKEDEVFAVLPELIKAARTEPGNLEFSAYRNMDDPLSYVLLERYVSREAFAEHRATQHFQELMIGQILPRLASRTIEQYDVDQDGDGSA